MSNATINICGKFENGHVYVDDTLHFDKYVDTMCNKFNTRLQFPRIYIYVFECLGKSISS